MFVHSIGGWRRDPRRCLAIFFRGPHHHWSSGVSPVRGRHFRVRRRLCCPHTESPLRRERVSQESALPGGAIWKSSHYWPGEESLLKILRTFSNSLGLAPRATPSRAFRKSLGIGDAPQPAEPSSRDPEDTDHEGHALEQDTRQQFLLKHGGVHYLQSPEAVHAACSRQTCHPKPLSGPCSSALPTCLAQKAARGSFGSMGTPTTSSAFRRASSSPKFCRRLQHRWFIYCTTAPAGTAT